MVTSSNNVGSPENSCFSLHPIGSAISSQSLNAAQSPSAMFRSEKRKKVKDMTPEEALKLTDDEVMEKLFGKRIAKKLRKVVESDEVKSS